MSYSIDELIENVNIKLIDSSVNFWMIRTKKGFFYDEFTQEGFIALGWNAILEKDILDLNSLFNNKERKLKKLKLQEYLKKKYPKNKQVSQTLNKCIRFITEIKNGDVIMIPSAHNNEVSFAIAGDYYEEDECTYEKEIEAIDRIDSGEFYGVQVECPYKKRRKINILKTISGKTMNINLYKALASYHGLSSINDYSDFILSSMYTAYYWRDRINLVFNVEQEGEIKAIDLSSFIYNTSSLINKLYSNIKVSTKVNLNSPGDVILVLQQYGGSTLELIKSHTFLLVIVSIWFGITGGQVGPVKFNSAAELIMKFREHNLKMKSDKLDIKKKEMEVLQLNHIEEIKTSSSSLKIDKDDVKNIIDFSSYHEKKDK